MYVHESALYDGATLPNGLKLIIADRASLYLAAIRPGGAMYLYEHSEPNRLGMIRLTQYGNRWRIPESLRGQIG